MQKFLRGVGIVLAWLAMLAIMVFSLWVTTIGLQWVLIPFGISMGFWTSFKMLCGLILVTEMLSNTKSSRKKD